MTSGLLSILVTELEDDSVLEQQDLMTKGLITSTSLNVPAVGFSIATRDEEKSPDVIRVKNYVEEIVPLYPDYAFRVHFRMNRETLQVK